MSSLQRPLDLAALRFAYQANNYVHNKKGLVSDSRYISFAGSANPSWIKIQGFPWYYYTGDAHDPSVQEVIKSQFHGLLTYHIVPPFFCLLSPSCNKDDFTVSPGVTGNYTQLNCVFNKELLIPHPPLSLTLFAKKIPNKRRAVIWSLRG